MASVASSKLIARELWIECQLTRSFLDNSNKSVIGFLFALPATLGMLVGYVPLIWLLLWSGAIALLVWSRFWSTKVLYQIDWMLEPEQFLKQFLRLSWSWPLTAAVWASSLLLYFHRVPEQNQFVCLLVLIGMGAFSVSLMSARLDVFTRYLDSMAVMTMTPMAIHLVFEFTGQHMKANIVLLMSTLVFWQLLRRTGRLYQVTARQGFGLQYDNEQLIANLRLQTATALEAVGTKDRLLANAAHDLRQPVHALAFYAELLRSDPQEAQQVMPKILTATDSVNTLFNSLFDFANLESKGVQPNVQIVPVCQLMEQMQVQFAPAARARHIELRCRVVPAHIATDPLLMQRIVGNLLANAIRHTDHGGVLLCSRVHKGRVRIEVWDTGTGIAPEHLPYVFREFYKVPKQGTEEGFGLGLAIVQRLCNAMGHRIVVDSRLGRGTRFRIELPLASPPAGTAE